MLVGFGLGIIGFFIIFSSRFTKVQKKHIRLGITFLIITAVTFVLGFGLTGIFKNAVSIELKRFIKDNESQIQIKIDNQKCNNPQPIIDELIKISSLGYHHSSPTRKLKIEILANGQSKQIVLGQDSQIKNEFWVFDTDFRTTSDNEIGKIKSNLFLQYIPETEQEKKEKIQLKIKNLEEYFGRENLKTDLISDTNDSEKITITNIKPVKLRLTYLPTGTQTFGLSNKEKDENYLEALQKLEKLIKEK